MAPLDGAVAVRDSKNRRGPALAMDGTAWTAFVSGIQSGQFEIH